MKITNDIKKILCRSLSLSKKKNELLSNALSSWLAEMRMVNPTKGRVLITALRNETWIEWAIYATVVLRQFGYESSLLYKSSELTSYYQDIFKEMVSQISGIQLIDIENLQYDEEVYYRYKKICVKPATAALAYDYHIESEDILENESKYGKELLALLDESAKNGARLFNFFSSNKFHQFICYSGIIYDTHMLLHAAKESSQEVVCVEGWAWRPGHMIYNFGAPALEYNIRGWMTYFGGWTKEKDFQLKKYMNFLDGNREDDEWLNNFYAVQRDKVRTELPKFISGFVNDNKPVFILLCNVIGDSSLLNRETIFKSHKDFIIKTVEYFSKNKNIKLIIRAHPAEEWVKGKVSIKLGKFSKEITKGMENIIVIDSDEKINTFSLVPFLRGGLVWLTSAGVDLVLRGIPVIAGASPKYAGLGIVEEPKSVEEYFNFIDKLSLNDIRTTAHQIQVAKEYLYVVFKGFSFEAQGRTYRADSCYLNNMPNQEEHDRFFKILLKEETAPDHTTY